MTPPLDTHTHTHMHACTNTGTLTRTCKHTHMHVHTCTCIYIHIHTSYPCNPSAPHPTPPPPPPLLQLLEALAGLPQLQRLHLGRPFGLGNSHSTPPPSSQAVLVGGAELGLLAKLPALTHLEVHTLRWVLGG